MELDSDLDAYTLFDPSTLEFSGAEAAFQAEEKKLEKEKEAKKEVKKPAKKRRSWGQELPTPTTNLPPRKRAKTQGEKEQRRIERVLRNRAAAHTSRERKRAEQEALEKRAKFFESEMNRLGKENVALKTQLIDWHNKYRQLENDFASLKSQLPSGMKLKEYPTIVTEQPKSNSVNLADIHQTATISSPESLTCSSSPREICSPRTPPPFDLTQHHATMLCSPSQDLQCQSQGSGSSTKLSSLTFSQRILKKLGMSSSSTCTVVTTVAG